MIHILVFLTAPLFLIWLFSCEINFLYRFATYLFILYCVNVIILGTETYIVAPSKLTKQSQSAAFMF